MNSDHPSHTSDTRTTFDDDARRAHAASLERLSPRVQAQLAQRRRAALSPNARPAAPRTRPMLALGTTAVLALAIGLFALRDTSDADSARTSDAVAVVATPTTDDNAIADIPPAAVAASTADSTIDNRAPAPTDMPSAALLAAEFANTDDAIGFAALDESPDFYLWLGSEEAQAKVTEVL